MKTRIIVAAIGIPVLFAVIFFAPIWALGILVGIIAGRSAWELLRCAEHDMPRRMRWVTAICAGCVPLASVFFPAGRVYELSLFVLFVYVFCELMLTFRRETPMALETATVTLLAGGIMPVLISAIVRLGLPGLCRAPLGHGLPRRRRRLLRRARPRQAEDHAPPQPAQDAGRLHRRLSLRHRLPAALRPDPPGLQL